MSVSALTFSLVSLTSPFLCHSSCHCFFHVSDIVIVSVILFMSLSMLLLLFIVIGIVIVIVIVMVIVIVIVLVSACHEAKL